MELIVLGELDVYELLPIADCIEVMEGAFHAVARGGFAQPQRLIAWLPDRRGAIGTMRAFLADPDAAGAKVITAPGQSSRGSGVASRIGAVARNRHRASACDRTRRRSARTTFWAISRNWLPAPLPGAHLPKQSHSSNRLGWRSRTSRPHASSTGGRSPRGAARASNIERNASFFERRLCCLSGL